MTNRLKAFTFILFDLKIKYTNGISQEEKIWEAVGKTRFWNIR